MLFGYANRYDENIGEDFFSMLHDSKFQNTTYSTT